MHGGRSESTGEEMLPRLIVGLEMEGYFAAGNGPENAAE